MSVSYIETEISPREKRPFREELWLWREWRAPLTKIFLKPLPEVEKQVKNMEVFMEQFNSEDKEL